MDPREFLKCVEALCRDTAPDVGAEASGEVRRLVAELRRTVGDEG
ncbi:hypothetical protein AB0J55_03445 [Amycolatopsis sp. NPDC049688]